MFFKILGVTFFGFFFAHILRLETKSIFNYFVLSEANSNQVVLKEIKTNRNYAGKSQGYKASDVKLLARCVIVFLAVQQHMKKHCKSRLSSKFFPLENGRNYNCFRRRMQKPTFLYI